MCCVDAVSTAIVDRLGVTWDERYGELKRYKERFGDCNVPAHSEGEFRQLGSWVNKNRTEQINGKLSADRKARLDELGFVWDVHESAWETMFAELKRYKEQFGDCNVSKWGEHAALGMWVTNQRARPNKVSAARKALLDQLGFIWDARELAWEEMVAALKEYRAETGHCNVPYGWKENPRLAFWVATQRSENGEGNLTLDRKALLDELGFVWDARELNWETMYAELKGFSEAHGHCKVPGRYEENPQLANWVRHQRVFKKSGALTQARIARLNELGFVWETRDNSWEVMFTALKHYKEKHGDCNVSQRREENGPLGKWVNKQRTRKDRLSPARIAQLDELGFVWNTRDLAWDRMFAELQRYKERFRDCNVPQRWDENPQLGTWVNVQRSRTLPPDRKALLDELGFVWEPRDARWETMFAELKLYKEAHGLCNVPSEWVENPKLGSWVSTQRQFERRGKLSPARRARLDALGFTWSRKS